MFCSNYMCGTEKKPCNVVTRIHFSQQESIDGVHSASPESRRFESVTKIVGTTVVLPATTLLQVPFTNRYQCTAAIKAMRRRIGERFKAKVSVR